MTEYSLQPNFMHSHFGEAAVSRNISAMPKKSGRPHALVSNRPKRPSVLPNLKKLRIDAGLTVAGLSELSGVSTGSISSIENGSQGYRDGSLMKLANALETTPDVLKGIDPASPDSLQNIWKKATKEQRRLIMKLAVDIVEP